MSKRTATIGFIVFAYKQGILQKIADTLKYEIEKYRFN